jgi:hypothetical protein
MAAQTTRLFFPEEGIQKGIQRERRRKRVRQPPASRSPKERLKKAMDKMGIEEDKRSRRQPMSTGTTKLIEEDEWREAIPGGEGDEEAGVGEEPSGNQKGSGPEKGPRGTPEEEEKKLGDKAKPKVMWISPRAYRKLQVAREALGVTWGEMVDIVLEQLCGAGVLDTEVQRELEAIDRQAGLEGKAVDQDLIGRESQGIGCRWSETGGLAQRIAAEAAQIRESLENMIETLEDVVEAHMEKEIQQ